MVVVGFRRRLVVVEPEILVPAVRFVPFFCHWKSNGGVPVTETLNQAGDPGNTVRLWGWDRISKPTVKVNWRLCTTPSFRLVNDTVAV